MGNNALARVASKTMNLEMAKDIKEAVYLIA
jgi:hypothetical protein